MVHRNGDGLLHALSVKVFIDVVLECDRSVSRSRTRRSEISAVASSTATGTYPRAGLRFVLSRAEISDRFVASISIRAHPVQDPATAGFIRVLSWDLKNGSSVFFIDEHPNHTRRCLEEFHQSYNQVRPHCAVLWWKLKIRVLQPRTTSKVSPSSFRNGEDGRKPIKRNSKNNCIEPMESVSQHDPSYQISLF